MMTSEVANRPTDFPGKMENRFRGTKVDVRQDSDISCSDRSLVIGLGVLGDSR